MHGSTSLAHRNSSLLGLGTVLWLGAASAFASPPPPRVDRYTDANTLELGFDEALAIARERAPALAIADARVREAEAGVEQAGVYRHNPQIQAAAGPRFEPTRRIVDWQIGLQQRVELGGQRRQRVAVAEALRAAEAGRRDDLERIVLREVGFAFIDALYWARRVDLETKALEIAEALATVARRRHELGDAAVDVVVTSAAEAATRRAELERARIHSTRVTAELGAWLGFDAHTRLRCRGQLDALELALGDPASVDERPDLRALDAEIEAANASGELAQRQRAPSLTVGARYGQEEGAHRVQGTLGVELPAFDRGQGERRAASAQVERLELERELTHHHAQLDAAADADAAQAWSTAARDYTQLGLAAALRAEANASASYEAGQIPLDEWLATRAVANEARREQLELLHRAARARVEAASESGVLR